MNKIREISPLKKVLILIILFILGSVLTSCSSNDPTEIIITLPSSKPTTIPDYTKWNQTDEDEGIFGRNDNCPISFSYQSHTLDKLTVAIDNNIVDTADESEIYQKIFQSYNQLINESPVTFDKPITVIVIPDLVIEKCTSHDSIVFISPETLDTNSLIQDMIGASTGISEYWVRAGLASLASGEEIDHQALKNWYQETEDLEILGLFVARFMPDWASQEEVIIARMTAASLTQHCLENENITAELIGDRINNDIRNRWLSSLGVERSVEYPYDGLYQPFQFSQSEDCSLLLNSDAMNYCINKLTETTFPYMDEVRDAEEFIYRTFYTHNAIKDYLLTNAPSISPLVSSDEPITIEVKALDVSLGYTQGKTVTIHNFAIPYYVSSMMVMTYDWYDELMNNDQGILLKYGFAEYIGNLLPIYEQPRKRMAWEDLNGLESSPGISFWFFLDEEQLTAAKAWYLQQGGSLEDEEAIDLRLFYDAITFATHYRDTHGGPLGTSIAERMEHLNPNYDTSDMDGLELNYTQAASYIAWLCDTYSIDTVLANYVNNDKTTTLEDKTYDVLKQAWIAELIAKGSGIPIPDSP